MEAVADEMESGNMINSMMITTEVVMLVPVAAVMDMGVIIANDTIQTDQSIIMIDHDHMIDVMVGQKVEVGEMLIEIIVIEAEVLLVTMIAAEMTEGMIHHDMKIAIVEILIAMMIQNGLVATPAVTIIKVVTTLVGIITKVVLIKIIMNPKPL